MLHPDVLIVGGGVIGLSLAYQLSRQGRRVGVIDRGPLGREASWAGAGILPPATCRPHDAPLDQLTGLSHALHAEWAERLREETGVDTGYRRCGGIYLARQSACSAELQQAAQTWLSCGIQAERLDAQRLREVEPALAETSIEQAWFLEQETQIRNPHHLRALERACVRQGVDIQVGISVDSFEVQQDRIVAACCGGRRFEADQFCIAGGAWTSGIVSRLGLRPAIKPIRGQIVLLAAPTSRLTRIVNEGHRYLVPRPDGRVLVGSTEEDVGFDKRTTACVVGELIHFALSLVPSLSQATVERTWAGLRPASGDGLPYLGRLPGYENAFMAAGHYRQGLHLSPGTAVVMSQLIQGERPEVDLTPFDPARDTAPIARGE